MRALVLRSAAVALLFAVAAPASAQSLFGSRGLGVLVSPIDARAAALGGSALALPGPSSAILNPADAADVSRRGVIVAIQPSSTDIEVAGGNDAVDATRFPLVQFHLPFARRFVLSAGYGGFLDQNWGVTSRSVEPVGDTVTAVDRITSTGGISQGRLGITWRAHERLALGAAAGLLSGSSRRIAHRSFEDDDAPLAPYQEVVETSYGAPQASFGARWRPFDILRVGAAFTWTGDLDIDVQDGADSQVSMPLQFAAGGSVELLDDLLLAASGRWSGWSSSESVRGSTPEDVLELGAGIEYSGLAIARRTLPLRIGARHGGQPFTFGAEAPAETALTFGLGARLAGTEESPLALVDFAIERGSRGDLEENGLAEDFWRATVSVSLFGQ